MHLLPFPQRPGPGHSLEVGRGKDSRKTVDILWPGHSILMWSFLFGPTGLHRCHPVLFPQPRGISLSRLSLVIKPSFPPDQGHISLLPRPCKSRLKPNLDSCGPLGSLVYPELLDQAEPDCFLSMSFIHPSSGLDYIYYPFGTRNGLKGSSNSVLLKLNKREIGGGNKPALGEIENRDRNRKSQESIKGTRKIESGATGGKMENRARDPGRKHLEERD